MKTPDAKPPALPAHVLEAALDVWSQAGEQNQICIKGHSMLPSIQSGDHALVAHGWAGVRRGDLVVFRRDGILVAHRVLRVHYDDHGPTFITKGDNAPQFDPPLSASEIVGRVLSIEQDGRQMALDTPARRTLAWCIAMGTLAWTALYRKARKLKQRVLGPQPNWLTASLRRGALALFSLLLKVGLAVANRWEKDPPL